MGTEAQDLWCEQVLDFIPPARRRGPVRAELRARRDAASATLARRIADAPGLAGEDLALRAGILAADLDRALAEPDLLDDSVTSGNFVTAVNSASAILDEMVKVAGETTALPGRVKAEADTRRAEIRNRLNDAFAARLAAQGAQQSRFLPSFRRTSSTSICASRRTLCALPSPVLISAPIPCRTACSAPPRRTRRTC